jgi:hypothetical protein
LLLAFAGADASTLRAATRTLGEVLGAVTP